jgi:hypothetical protein
MVDDDLVPNGNSKIYIGSDVTKNHLAMLAMSFVIRHRLTSVCLKDLLVLLNIVVPGCVPKTNYYVDKFTRSRLHNVQHHFYCANCNYYFGLSALKVCTKCQHSSTSDSESPYMMVLPIKDQLQELLEQNSWDQFLFTDNNNDNDSSIKCDVTSGKMYTSLKNKCAITLQFNCDGAAVFKSSAFSIWPLTCTISELPLSIRNKHPILHTLWFGPSKPSCNTYLKPFIDEIRLLYDEGIHWQAVGTNAPHHAYVAATLCICDAPARAMVQELTQFNGKYGCGFCYHPGERVEKGRGFVQVYPMNDVAEIRTHSETLHLAELAVETGTPTKGIKGVSPLFLLPSFDIVHSIVPEYMHNILLGVTRQFISIWTDSANSSQEFFIRNVSHIDEIMLRIKPPAEIKRLPRRLSQMKFWKASELRHFLLLYSPVVLKDVLPRAYYAHWLLLVNGVTVLLGDAITSEMLSLSRSCFNKFVVLVSSLYGKEYVSYNVHCLSHLTDAVINWGPLWAHSAFVFEDVIRFLKTLYHGTQPVPKQVFQSFCTWKSIQHRSALMGNANEDVKSLFSKLTKSRRLISDVTRSGSFVGLGNAVDCRMLGVTQGIAVRNLLGFDASSISACQWFDRFIVDGRVITTARYSSDHKRCDSVVVTNDNHFAQVVSAVVMKVCSCSDYCNCPTKCVLFVHHDVVRGNPAVHDSFVGTNLSAFMYRVCGYQAETKALLCDSIESKCVLISGTGGVEFIIKLPTFEFE